MHVNRQHVGNQNQTFDWQCDVASSSTYTTRPLPSYPSLLPFPPSASRKLIPYPKLNQFPNFGLGFTFNFLRFNVDCWYQQTGKQRKHGMIRTV